MSEALTLLGPVRVVVNTGAALLWVNGRLVPPGGTAEVLAHPDGQGRYVFSAEVTREEADE